MAWILLVVAGLLEVVWAYTMKLSDGFTRLSYSSITIVAMIASFGLLSLAMKSLPLGTATRSGRGSEPWARSSSASLCWARLPARRASSRLS
nr:multidrug efflux SMR transporter [Myxococcus sp. AB036A]